MLRRNLAVLQHQLENDSVPSPVLLGRLRHFWSNDGWSAGTEFLEGMLRWLPKTRGTVLECGSGLSTLLLAAATAGRARQVVSLEHDCEWAERVRAALPVANGLKVEVSLSPIKSYGDFDWYTLTSLQRLSEVGFVVCDGPPGATRGGRYGLGPVMKQVFAPGCLVMLDDVARPEERSIIARWRIELSADLVEETERYCVMRIGAD